MKYKIVYDGVGRIRFRCGQYAFSQEDESRIEAFLMKQSYIESVKASYANGGILVMYKGQHKSGIISAIAAMDVKKLPACENGSGYSVGMIEKKFRKDIIKIVAKRIVYRLFLPAPLRTVITAVKGAGFILKGIDELMAGRLTVEVLDAASITACLAQRDYKTAGSVMFLLSVSSLLESYTKAKTKAALTDSLMIRTDKLWKVDDDGERQVSMSELEPGDRIRIQTGSIIPVDGEVTDGQAEVNEASMTCPKIPVSVR